MERNYILLMGLFLLLVAVGFSSSDPKGNVSEENVLDQKVDGIVDPVNGNDVSKSISDSIGVDEVKENGGDQVNELEKGIQSDTSKSKLNQQSGSNEGDNLHKDGNESGAEAKGKMVGKKNGENLDKGQGGSDVDAKGKTDGQKEDENLDEGREGANVEFKVKKDVKKEHDNVHKDDGESNVETNEKMGSEKGDNINKGDEESIIEAKGNMDGEKKESLGDKLDPKEVTEEKNNEQDSLPPPPPPNIQGEECDPSNMCMDKNKRFAACLQVPGDDFLDLSLLIRNKGNGPLTIKISAPAFVHLEATEVKLREKQDKKVKVSIKDSGAENFIVLKDGSGECSLDLKDFMVHNSAKAYVNILSRTPTTAFIFVVAILILASGWICMNVKRRRVARHGLKHQRLEMELPVSSRAKTEPHVNDGWKTAGAIIGMTRRHL